MPDHEPQPEAADVMQRKTQLEEVYRDAHAQWAETDTYVQGTNKVFETAEGQAERPVRRSNQGRTILDHTSDNILPYSPAWTRDPLTKATDAQATVDDVEAFTDAAWHDATVKEMYIPAKEWGRNLIKYDYAPGEIVFDISDMPKEPTDKKSMYYEAELREWEGRKWNLNPFGVKAPHPTHLLLPPYERRPSYGIKVEKWTQGSIKKYLDSKRADRDAGNDAIVSIGDFEVDNPFKPMEVVEEQSKGWHSLIVDGMGDAPAGLMLQEANIHQLVPFIHAWAGWGDTPGGEDGQNPKYRGQGFLYPALPLIRLLDQIISAKAELEMKAAFGLLVAPEQFLERIADILRQGGNMVPGDVREVGFMPIPQLPQFLADFQDRVEQAIVRATISTVAFGERPVGVDTVGQHAMMLQVSFKRVVEATEQLSFMASETASMWLKMFANSKEQLPDGLTIRGKHLSVERLQQNYHIDATFTLTDEAVKMNRTQLGSQLVLAGHKSLKRHLEEDQGVTNVTKELDQILQERVMADPILASAFAEQVRVEENLQDMYEKQLARMAAEAASQTQGGAGLPGFTPPQTDAEMTAEGAEQQVLTRPPAASPGAGQRGGR
ncbi:MAG: hypothetical protein U0990_00950 [Candidatus Nanopelagicales bacterium]|nr:hypothetical protein [Candidatus Nanopelagicales bacterium]